MKFTITLIALLTTLTISMAQETNKEQPSPNIQSQFQNDKRGMNGPHMRMMNRGSWNNAPREPMVKQSGCDFGARNQEFQKGMGNQFRKGFYGDGAIQRGCPLCKKHKMMLSKKHANERGGKSYQRGPRHHNFVK